MAKRVLITSVLFLLLHTRAKPHSFQRSYTLLVLNYPKNSGILFEFNSPFFKILSYQSSATSNMSWQFGYRNHKKLPVGITPTRVIPADLHGSESACTVCPTLSTSQNSIGPFIRANVSLIFSPDVYQTYNIPQTFIFLELQLPCPTSWGR